MSSAMAARFESREVVHGSRRSPMWLQEEANPTGVSGGRNGEIPLCCGRVPEAFIRLSMAPATMGCAEAHETISRIQSGWDAVVVVKSASGAVDRDNPRFRAAVRPRLVAHRSYTRPAGKTPGRCQSFCVLLSSRHPRRLFGSFPGAGPDCAMPRADGRAAPPVEGADDDVDAGSSSRVMSEAISRLLGGEAHIVSEAEPFHGAILRDTVLVGAVSAEVECVVPS
jgi:hypothetical protein